MRLTLEPPAVALVLIFGLPSLVLALPSCVGSYGKCGGDGWDGRNCCPGNDCQVQSQFYSQCVPSAGAAAAGTTMIVNGEKRTGGGSGGVANGDNPFMAARGGYYVNAEYQQRVRASMQARWADDGKTSSVLENMLSVPSAFWVDRIARIEKGDATDPTTLASILSDASARSPPPLVVAILYDLPNRDCHA